MSLTPKHSPLMAHFDEAPETGFHDITVQPPVVPRYMQDCYR